MYKPVTFAAAALSFLVACEEPQQGFTVTPEAMARGNAIDSNTIAPSASPSTIISTFDQFCGRFPANPRGTQRAVEGAGYFKLGSSTADGLEMWASDDGRPLVATGSRDGAKVCMVLMDKGASLDRAVADYVAQKHGGAGLDMGSMQIGADTAENVFVVPSTPPVIYFTLVQQQPGLGTVEALAIVTE